MKESSGKFVLRLPPNLHEFLRQTASKKGKSLNQICLESLSKYEKNEREEGLQERLSHLVETIKTHELGKEVLGIVLFGSTAKHKRFDKSDIDLLIILDNSYPLTRAVYHLWDNEFSENEEPLINPHFCHLPKSPLSAGSLWFEITEEGIVLWDRNRQIDILVRKLRSLRRQKKIVKQNLHGHNYWVRREYAQS